MSYKPYVDKKYYINAYGVKTIPTDDDVDKYLEKASREIDTMTFNRIVGIGFDNLTEFQQEIVQKVNCQLADFEYENQDLLNSVLSSYSINNVKMDFATNETISKINGVIIPNDIYRLLEQTGLTCLNMRW